MLVSLHRSRVVFPELSGLHEFEAQKSHEVNEFRSKLHMFCEEKAQERQNLPWQQWMEYSFPCDLEPCCSPAGFGKVKLKHPKLFINVKFEACDVSCFAFVVAMSHVEELLMLWFKGAAVVEPTKSTVALIGKMVLLPCVDYL